MRFSAKVDSRQDLTSTSEKGLVVDFSLRRPGFSPSILHARNNWQRDKVFSENPCLSCQLAFHPCSILIHPSSVVQKIGTLQTAVAQTDKLPIHHTNENNKWKPHNSQDTETNLTYIFTTFPSTYFDARHVSIGLAPSHSQSFSPFLLHLSSSVPHKFVTKVSMSTESFFLYFLVVYIFVSIKPPLWRNIKRLSLFHCCHVGRNLKAVTVRQYGIKSYDRLKDFSLRL